MDGFVGDNAAHLELRGRDAGRGYDLLSTRPLDHPEFSDDCGKQFPVLGVRSAATGRARWRKLIN